MDIGPAVDHPRLDDRGAADAILARYPNAIPISAKSRAGIDRLRQATSIALSRSFVDVDVETGAGNGRLLAYLARYGEVLSRRYHDGRVTVHCRLPQEHLGRIRDEDTRITPRPFNGADRDTAPREQPPLRIKIDGAA